MGRSLVVPRASDAGFLLLEAVVAAALFALCAGAALAAVAAAMHAGARALPPAALAQTARNVLTDLRAATAYDPVQLSALAGRSIDFDAAEPGPDGQLRRVHITAAVTRPAATGAYVATVTVRAAGGTAATAEATLVQEAPAPGSVIPASTPPPAGAARFGLAAAPAPGD